MVRRPNATLSWTLRFIKTDDRPMYFRRLCFSFDGYDNLKIDYENILFLFYVYSGVCCFCPIENQ